MGQEFRTNYAAEHQESCQGESGGSDGDGEDAMVDGPADGDAIFIAQENHYGIGPFFHTVAEDQQREDRRNHDRENQSAEQGERAGPGHGLEEAAFDALQSEDGQIRCDDNGAGVKNGAEDFHYGIANNFQRRLLQAGRQTEMADDVLDDDYGAVNDHSEIECAEREEIRGNFIEVEAYGSEEERERNGERDDECAAGISEEEEEDYGDEQDAFGEIFQDRVRGEMHEIAAVEERGDFHTRREDLVIQLVFFFMDGDEGFVGVSAFAEKDDAFDDVVVVNDSSVRAVNSLPYLSQTNARALGYGGDVFHAKGGTVFRGEDGLLDVLDVAEQAHDADIDLLQAGFDEATAGVGVVVSELLLDLGDAQAMGDEGVGIDADLIFAGNAAEAGDVNNGGHGLELLFEGPILDGFEFHQVVFGIGAAQRVPINLADGAPVSAHLRLQAGGERDLRQALENFRAIPIVDGAVVENQHYAGEPEE